MRNNFVYEKNVYGKPRGGKIVCDKVVFEKKGYIYEGISNFFSSGIVGRTCNDTGSIRHGACGVPP